MILLAAATPWEARAAASALGPRGGFRVLETGVGPARVRAALLRLEGEACRGVLSAGLAGGLRPGIRSGDIVLDGAAAPSSWTEAARRAASGRAWKLHMGSIASSDRVLRGPREKAAFAAGCAALAVDMESGALREWASGRGASFLAARAVLDEAADSLPSGVPEGHGFWDLARYALAHFREVPAMARAASRMGPALENLRAFLRVWLGEVKSDE